ncbi:hypothetical protein Tco_0495671, partial [Tanacetum coccineum]
LPPLNEPCPQAYDATLDDGGCSLAVKRLLVAAFASSVLTSMSMISTVLTKLEVAPSQTKVHPTERLTLSLELVLDRGFELLQLRSNKQIQFKSDSDESGIYITAEVSSPFRIYQDIRITLEPMIDELLELTVHGQRIRRSRAGTDLRQFNVQDALSMLMTRSLLRTSHMLRTPHLWHSHLIISESDPEADLPEEDYMRPQEDPIRLIPAEGGD